MKIPGAVISALLVVFALVLVNYCGERRGAAKAEARARDAGTDSTVRVLQAAARDSGLAIARVRDSTGREIRRLQRRWAALQAPGAVTAPRDSSPPAVSAPDVRDTLIVTLVDSRRADSLALVFWKAQVAQRDTVINALQASRNTYRARSEKSYLLTDVGGGAIAGYGVAEKCSACVVAGAATIVLPRLWTLLTGR